MVDTSEDMAAMVATEARGRPRLTTDMVDTAAMVAMDMVATVERGRPRLLDSTDMVDTEAVSAATDTMVINFIVE